MAVSRIKQYGASLHLFDDLGNPCLCRLVDDCAGARFEVGEDSACRLAVLGRLDGFEVFERVAFWHQAEPLESRDGVLGLEQAAID